MYSLRIEGPSLESKVPELPSFITLLHKHFEGQHWAEFLHNWEGVIFALIVATLLSLFLTWAIRKKELIPDGLQNGVEWVYETLEELIVKVVGEKQKKFASLLITIFIYVFAMNIFGLIPFMRSPSANLNITAALAICIFSLVQFLNIKHYGFFGFLHHMAGSPRTWYQWLFAPFMFFLELIAQLARPLTLALRLFGNILGEDILIGAFALFGVVLFSGVTTYIGLPLQVPSMLFALLASLMQALVFTLLSAVYILLSLNHSHE